MMSKPKELPFPLLGVNRGRGTSKQPFATVAAMINMRLFDVLDGRARGGSRPGQNAWGNADLIGGNNQPVVAMCVVSSVI
jgi:hypothetical protein